jgi:hypothetical protein
MKAQTLAVIVLAVAVLAGALFMLNYQRGQPSTVIAVGDEVYFTGKIMQMPDPNLIGAKVWQVQVLGISQDPNSHLTVNQIISVYWADNYLGHVDNNITKFSLVEVYGKFMELITDGDDIYVRLNELRYFMQFVLMKTV